MAGTLAIASSSRVLPVLAEDGQGTIKAAETGGVVRRQGDTGGDYWQKVAQIFQTDGMLMPGEVFMIDLPRSELQVTVAGVRLKPHFMLEHEITFFRTGDDEVVMKFELPLLDSEVNPVLSGLLEQGLDVAAIHNHTLDTTPPLKYMHGIQRGNTTQLAQALRNALSRTSTPFGQGGSSDEPLDFNADRLAQILGGDKEVSGGVVTVMVERQETFWEKGVILPPAMQLESMFMFQSAGNGQVAAGGEILVLPQEVQAVSRVLRQNNFLITALHNHELAVQPVIFWLHYWAIGGAEQLAQGLKAALFPTNSRYK
jgi:hypothetical protein